MSDSAVETRAGCKGRRRHSGSIRDAPVCDHHQTPGETETVPGASDGAFVGQMLRDLLEPAPDEPVEWLQEEKGLANAVKQLPRWITAYQVGQLVCEEAFLVFEGEIADPLGAADFRLSDARGKGHWDSCRSAQPNGPAQTHGGGQPVEEPSRGTKAARLQQPSEIQNRSAEDQQRKD